MGRLGWGYGGVVCLELEMRIPYCGRCGYLSHAFFFLMLMLGTRW